MVSNLSNIDFLNPSPHVYLTITDYINKRPFNIVSPMYDTEVPIEIEDGTFLPIYEPEDRAMGHSKATIAKMIHMRKDNIPFFICNKLDMIEIKIYLDMYLEQIYEHKGNKEVDDFLSMTSTFQYELTQNLKKLILSDPVLKAEQQKKTKFDRMITKKNLADTIAERYRYANTNK